MGTIAQGFDARKATTAKGDPMARLKRLSIGSLDRDFSGHPQRAGYGAIRRDFGDHGNLLGQIGLDVGLTFLDGIGQ